jgi:hypothetical protein
MVDLDKLKVLEDLGNGESIKACSRKHNVAPKNVRWWRSQREAVLQVTDTICDAMTRHSFLNRQTMHTDRGGLTPQYIDNVSGAYRKGSNYHLEYPCCRTKETQ